MDGHSMNNWTFAYYIQAQHCLLVTLPAQAFEWPSMWSGPENVGSSECQHGLWKKEWSLTVSSNSISSCLSWSGDDRSSVSSSVTLFIAVPTHTFIQIFISTEVYHWNCFMNHVSVLCPKPRHTLSNMSKVSATHAPLSVCICSGL